MLTELTEGFFTGEEGDSSMSTYSSSSLDEEEFSVLFVSPPAKCSLDAAASVGRRFSICVWMG